MRYMCFIATFALWLGLSQPSLEEKILYTGNAGMHVSAFHLIMPDTLALQAPFRSIGKLAQI